MIENEGRRSNQAGAEGSSSIKSTMEAIFRHRWAMLSVMAFVFSVALLWTFATPRRFDSEMVLIVQNARANQMVTAGQASGTATVSDVTEEQLNSEVAVLDSNDLLSEVAEPGWTVKSHAFSLPREELLRHERAVRKVASRLDVAAVRSSHVINVKVAAHTPEEARDILTRLLANFLQMQRDLGHLPGSSAVFSAKADQYSKELGIARANLAEFQNRNGLVSVNTQETAELQKLIELQSSARDTDATIKELEQRTAVDRRQIAVMPERLSTLKKTVPATQTIDQLNLLLVNLRNRQTELLTKLNPNDRLVLEVNQQIANTTEGLKAAQNLTPSELSTDVNPLLQASQRDLMISVATLNGLRARRDILRTQADALQARLNKVERQAGDYGALQQRVDEAEARYRDYAQRRDASLVNDLMDQQQWLNVAVAEYPTLSLIPSHPQPAIDIALGLLTALLFGGCTVALLEMARSTFATPVELESSSHYPVLATIPFAALESGRPQLPRAAGATSPSPVLGQGQSRSDHLASNEPFLEGQA